MNTTDSIHINANAINSETINAALNPTLTFWLQSELFLMPNWKWIGLAVAISAGLLIQSLLFRFILNFKNSEKVRAKAHDFFLYFIEQDIHRPLSWIVSSMFWIESLEGLQLHLGFTKYILIFLKIFAAYFVIRLAYMAVDAVGSLLEALAKKTENTLDDQLAPFFTKTLRVVVIVLGILILLQNLGVNVMSLLAGLGLGGLALALAAQDTAANVFGSIMIILDRPFQVGDWIKVADTEGCVEEIGFRSTRVRTFYNSLITIPNSVMAKEKIDNMGARPTRRIRHTIGIAYETSTENMKQFEMSVLNYLEQNPLVDKANITVRFNLMGDFNLQILVNCFIYAATGPIELQFQEDLLFFIKDVAAKINVEFAYPTQTIYAKNSNQNQMLQN